MDDGPATQDESLAMASVAVEDGIHTILATPHTLNGVYLNPAGEILSRVAELQRTLSENKIGLRLYPGADIHLCAHMLDLIERGEAITINNAGKYILLELPSQAIPVGVKDEIFALKLNGITPIITHPERNAVIQHDPNTLYELVSMGALGQVTAMSLTGGFGTMALGSSEIMLRHRLVHIIASDAHSAENRPPVLSAAVEYAEEVLGSHEEAARMVNDIPGAILKGDIPDIPEPIPLTHRIRP